MMLMWEQHDYFFIRFEIQIIERFQTADRCIAALAQDGSPAGCTTITAVDHRKILLRLLCIQIMGNGIGHTASGHFGYQTTQFTHPELNLYIQKRSQAIRFPGPCMGDQSQKCVYCSLKWIGAILLVAVTTFLGIINRRRIIKETFLARQAAETTGAAEEVSNSK